MSDNDIDYWVDLFGPSRNREIHDRVDRAGNEDDDCVGDILNVRFGVCPDHFRRRANPGTEDDNGAIGGDGFRWGMEVDKRTELG
jgi:hypothetical protein